jgi:NADH:ubiquinone oxidoreductase subunit K
MITLTDFLIVSAALFCTGMYMMLSKRNAIQILIGIELMLNAAILNLVAFGKYDKINNAGQVFALFAIVLNVYRRYKTINAGEINKLRD